MRDRRQSCVGLCVALGAWVLLPSTLSAQAAASSEPTEQTDPRSVRGYFHAFAERRLTSSQTAEVTELRSQLAEAESLALQGRASEAVLLLIELTEHPRYADYAELTELSAAHYALGSVLGTLGAAGSGQKSLHKVLERGPEDPYFAPSFRRYVDIALEERQLQAAIEALRQYEPGLSRDAQSELSYLEGRERLQAGDASAAKAALARVEPGSRFFASAQLELGSLAADERAYAQAQERMCRVAQLRDDSRQSLLTDARYYAVKDLVLLGLGRVAHEQRRGRDAFDHYFRIPSDSPHLAEALFEAAYARYEAGDSDTAIDLLDQLQARFPQSPYADEASLLRGYVALARCDFSAAEQQFARFEARFGPVQRALARVLQNPARREAVYEALRAPSEAPEQSEALRTILGLLRHDPVFAELHARVQQLDRQAAGASRLPGSFALLRARYTSGDRPLAVPAGPEDEAGLEQARALEELRVTVEDTRVALRALTEQLDTLRALGVPEPQLSEQERVVAGLSARQQRLRAALDQARFAHSAQLEAAHEPDAKPDVQALLEQDEQHARGFDARAQRLRRQLVRAANERARHELFALHKRLGSFLRRARIGHIDAAMGDKRRIEREIESLAKGRFPPELRARPRTQAYLGDDEEYWPYEGEDWPDEYEWQLQRAGQP